MPFVAYARTAAVFGKSAKFDVAVPYGFLSGDGYLNGTYVDREVDGFADPQFRGSINLIEAPALAFPVNKRNSIKLYANTGVSTRTGSDFNTYGAAWQHRWGGGL